MHATADRSRAAELSARNASLRIWGSAMRYEWGTVLLGLGSRVARDRKRACGGARVRVALFTAAR